MASAPLFTLSVEQAAHATEGEESSANPTDELLYFSAGNPRVERVSGVVHLYRERKEEVAGTSSEERDELEKGEPSTSKGGPQRKADDLRSRLPPGRDRMVCVPSVPAKMSASEFCYFVGATISQVEEVRFVRNEARAGESAALLKFRSQETADSFYAFYNGRRFHSLASDVCHVLFVRHFDVTTFDSEAKAMPPENHTEVPSCPVCLERLDEDASGVVTTVCSHSFHSSCLSGWTEASCPVCRYCEAPPEPPKCSQCGSTNDLWICLICGSVGCGRYSEGHAKQHWQDTSHCYSMELLTKRVWDYVGDNYVHRLLQSKNGQLVEVPGANVGSSDVEDPQGFCSAEAFEENPSDHNREWQQAVLNSKADAIAWEYNQLLTSQLESQRQYFEGAFPVSGIAELLSAATAGNPSPEGENSASAIERSASVVASAVKARKESESKRHDAERRLEEMRERAQKAEEELSVAKQLNDSLVRNQKDYQARLNELERHFKEASEEKDGRIHDLEEQVRDLMVYIDAQNTVEGSPEMKEGTVLSVRDGSSHSVSSSSRANRHKGKGKRRET